MIETMVLERQIDLTQRELDRVSSELSESPRSPGLRLTLKSLEKILNELNAEFLETRKSNELVEALTPQNDNQGEEQNDE